MSELKRLVRRHWLKAVALAIVAYVLVYHVDWAEFRQAFAEVAWIYVFLAVVANFISIMLKAASWKIIFDFSFKGVHGRWRDLVSAIMIGFLVNALIPARAGELARSFVISRRQSLLGRPVSRSTVLGTVVLERVFDGIALALIVVYGVFVMDLPTWANRGAIVLMGMSVFFAILLVVLEAKRERLKDGAASAQAGRREHHPWWRKLSIKLYGILARFSEGQRTLRSPPRVVAIFITTNLSWMFQLLAVYFTLSAFHLGQIGAVGALLLLILINVAGAMPVTPGNVGIFQLATVIPLTVTYDVSKTTALAFSIGLQVIEGSIGVGGGSLSLIREGLSFEQVRSESLRDFAPRPDKAAGAASGEKTRDQQGAADR